MDGRGGDVVGRTGATGATDGVIEAIVQGSETIVRGTETILATSRDDRERRIEAR